MSILNAWHPWVFHRDEVDLLEDEMEDLYKRYQDEEGEEESFEAAVLREQWETQEQSDEILAERLGFDEPEEEDDEPTVCDQDHHSCESHEQADLHLNAMLRIHPLYRQAKAWARRIRPHARSVYEHYDGNAHDLFRIYANANLVPLKVFAALTEEAYGDEIGRIIAQEEYRLALTYIGRIQDSLRLASIVYDEQTWMEAAQQDGRDLRGSVQERFEALRSRPPGV